LAAAEVGAGLRDITDRGGTDRALPSNPIETLLPKLGDCKISLV